MLERKLAASLFHSTHFSLMKNEFYFHRAYHFTNLLKQEVKLAASLFHSNHFSLKKNEFYFHRAYHFTNLLKQEVKLAKKTASADAVSLFI